MSEENSTERSSIDVIDEFVRQYTREFDYYDQCARTAAAMLDSEIRAQGIRAIVTHRAKQPSRLRAKLIDREQTYVTLDDVRQDVVDLAGVRVALYFAGDRPRANMLVVEMFDAVNPRRDFPTEKADVNAEYKRRFIGYSATHHRVRLRSAGNNSDRERFSDARIEIQVASLLMHAWAEVEHDLVYKPLSGALSSDEYAILDELNGMVLAAEIATERLQVAGRRRVSENTRPFENSFELAAFVVGHPHVKSQLATGRLHFGDFEKLLDLLQMMEANSPGQIAAHLVQVQPDSTGRTIVDQIANLFVSQNSKFAVAWEKIVAGGKQTDQWDRMVGMYLKLYHQIEHAVDAESKRKSGGVFVLRRASNWVERARTYGVVEETMVPRLEFHRSLRNRLVYGRVSVLSELQSAHSDLEALASALAATGRFAIKNRKSS